MTALPKVYRATRDGHGAIVMAELQPVQYRGRLCKLDRATVESGWRQLLARDEVADTPLEALRRLLAREEEALFDTRAVLSTLEKRVDHLRELIALGKVVRR